MSDIQNPLTARQHHLQQQVQQRQILAMMGIGQWMQPSSATLKIDDISHPTETAHINLPSAENPVDQSTSTQDTENLAAPSLVVADSEWPNRANAVTLPLTDNTDNNASQIMPMAIEAAASLIEQTTAPIGIDSFDIVNSDLDDNGILDKVAPFDLQGGRYNNWVLLVDIQALNSDSQKLWQNITQALSLVCETISFPICAGMDTVELANASFAGYLFKIGRSEEIQVAALTELPTGVTHPNVVSVATLEAMLADSTLKRQLWEQISQ